MREKQHIAINPADAPRLLAASIVAHWIECGAFPDRLIESLPSLKPVVSEMALGTVRWARELDWFVARHVRNMPDAFIRAVFLVACYQIFHMAGEAEYAVVNDAVNMVKLRGYPEQMAGLVNASLRRIAANREDLRRAVSLQGPGIRWSHPDCLVNRWQERWGARRMETFCRWNNERPDLTIRLFPSRISKTAFLAVLREAGINAEPHPFSPDNYLIVPRGRRVTDLPGYEQGWFIVQDPSTGESVKLLGAKAGERVLDACAAPGGKTMAIAEAMQVQGELVAMDRDPGRLERLRENARRMGFGCVRVVAADLADPGAAVSCGTGFDRILLDLPCSNTGVLRRRADARWRFSVHNLGRIVRSQRAMLTAATRLLRAGGAIVFSTCSVEPEEGQTLVKAWLRHHRDFELIRQIALFPPQSHTDGIYAALLRNRPG